MNNIDSPYHNIHYYVFYCLIIFKRLPTDMFLCIYQLLVLSVVCFELKFCACFSSINVVVHTACSHYTLQAKLALCTLFYTEELFYFLFNENYWA